MPPLRGFLILQWTRSTQMPSLRDLRAHIYLTFSTLCVRVLGPKHFFKTKKYLFFLQLTPIVRLQTAPTNFMGYRSNMGTGNELPYYELPEFGTSWKRRDSQIPPTRKTRAVANRSYRVGRDSEIPIGVNLACRLGIVAYLIAHNHHITHFTVLSGIQKLT